jgi:hypothetical protein
MDNRKPDRHRCGAVSEWQADKGDHLQWDFFWDLARGELACFPGASGTTPEALVLAFSPGSAPTTIRVFPVLRDLRDPGKPKLCPLIIPVGNETAFRISLLAKAPLAGMATDPSSLTPDQYVHEHAFWEFSSDARFAATEFGRIALAALVKDEAGNIRPEIHFDDPSSSAQAIRSRLKSGTSVATFFCPITEDQTNRRTIRGPARLIEPEIGLIREDGASAGRDRICISTTLSGLTLAENWVQGHGEIDAVVIEAATLSHRGNARAASLAASGQSLYGANLIAGTNPHPDIEPLRSITGVRLGETFETRFAVGDMLAVRLARGRSLDRFATESGNTAREPAEVWFLHAGLSRWNRVVWAGPIPQLTYATQPGETTAQRHLAVGQIAARLAIARVMAASIRRQAACPWHDWATSCWTREAPDPDRVASPAMMAASAALPSTSDTSGLLTRHEMLRPLLSVETGWTHSLFGLERMCNEHPGRSLAAWLYLHLSQHSLARNSEERKQWADALDNSKALQVMFLHHALATRSDAANGGRRPVRLVQVFELAMSAGRTPLNEQVALATYQEQLDLSLALDAYPVLITWTDQVRDAVLAAFRGDKPTGFKLDQFEQDAKGLAAGLHKTLVIFQNVFSHHDQRPPRDFMALGHELTGLILQLGISVDANPSERIGTLTNELNTLASMTLGGSPVEPAYQAALEKLIKRTQQEIAGWGSTATLDSIEKRATAAALLRCFDRLRANHFAAEIFARANEIRSRWKSSGFSLHARVPLPDLQSLSQRAEGLLDTGSDRRPGLTDALRDYLEEPFEPAERALRAHAMARALAELAREKANGDWRSNLLAIGAPLAWLTRLSAA